MPTPDALIPRLRELCTEMGKECEQLSLELREIGTLLKEMAGEIEKLQRRQAEAAAQVTQVEANPAGYSLADIKRTYSDAQDAQLRLYMMRSRSEQLQHKQRLLLRYSSQLSQVCNLAAQTLEVASAGSPAGIPGSVRTDASQGMTGVIQAREAQRRHLSQQLHDGPAQSLTNLILQTEIVERLMDADLARARAELANLKSAANASFQQVHAFISDLHPVMLDDLGLLPTLKRYVQTYEGRTHLAALLAVHGQRTLASHIEATLLRAVQELLSNTAQHAHASRAEVTLELDTDPVLLTVEDDGSGFDVEHALAAARAGGGSGLADLQTQVEMLGGRLEITSSPEQGTRVDVRVPAL